MCNNKKIKFPNCFYIEPTNHCNLKCQFCPTPTSKRKKGFLDFDLFCKIADQIPKGSWVHLYHSGEPLLHKKIVDMVKYIKNSGSFAKIVTNATLLNEKLGEDLINSKLDIISFSFDAAEKELYEKRKVGANYEDVLNKIKTFLKKRKSLQVKIPHTMITMVKVPGDNYQVDDFMKIFTNMGIDEPLIKRFVNWGGLVDEEEPDYKVDIYSIAPPLCTEPFVKILILWDGTVIPCCVDMDAQYNCGSVLKNNLVDIWNGSKLINLRNKLMDKSLYINLPKKCKNCTDMFRLREPFIDKIIK